MLDGGQRQQVVDTLIAVLGGAYAHLPAKRAAYALDPVQELTLLRRRVTDLSDAEFHLAVSGVVTRLRDAHTRYIGPVALRGRVAALPFLVEQYGPYDDPQFLVTKTAPEVVGRRRRSSPASGSSGGTASRSPAPSRSTPTARPVGDPTPGGPEPWSR